MQRKEPLTKLASQAKSDGFCPEWSFARGSKHIEIAHTIWQQLLRPGDLAIDCTAGNGHDTLFLAQLGCDVLAFDIQEQALASTKSRLQHCTEANVRLIHDCHSRLQAHVGAQRPRLVVYNLGYLPGGDKAMTTRVATTLESVRQALDLLLPGGLVSITCYPGHEEGAHEEKALLAWAALLDPQRYTRSRYQPERASAPSLLIVRRESLQENIPPI